MTHPIAFQFSGLVAWMDSNDFMSQNLGRKTDLGYWTLGDPEGRKKNTKQKWLISNTDLTEDEGGLGDTRVGRHLDLTEVRGTDGAEQGGVPDGQGHRQQPRV